MVCGGMMMLGSLLLFFIPYLLPTEITVKTYLELKHRHAVRQHQETVSLTSSVSFESTDKCFLVTSDNDSGIESSSSVRSCTDSETGVDLKNNVITDVVNGGKGNMDVIEPILCSSNNTINRLSLSGKSKSMLNIISEYVSIPDLKKTDSLISISPYVTQKYVDNYIIAQKISCV